jgi:hypothetical protein
MKMSEELKLLPEGFVTCPDCNHDNQIQLVDVFSRVDMKVDPDSELPNVYVVSVLKCLCCDETFELERVDVRFGLPTPSTTSQINEISFGEFTVYTTLSPEEAIPMAKQWYYDHFDYPLEEPVVRTVGTTIFTSDPRVIVIPEEDSEYENQRRD